MGEGTVLIYPPPPLERAAWQQAHARSANTCTSRGQAEGVPNAVDLHVLESCRLACVRARADPCLPTPLTPKLAIHHKAACVQSQPNLLQGAPSAPHVLKNRSMRHEAGRTAAFPVAGRSVARAHQVAARLAAASRRRVPARRRLRTRAARGRVRRLGCHEGGPCGGQGRAQSVRSGSRSVTDCCRTARFRPGWSAPRPSLRPRGLAAIVAPSRVPCEPHGRDGRQSRASAGAIAPGSATLAPAHKRPSGRWLAGWQLGVGVVNPAMLASPAPRRRPPASSVSPRPPSAPPPPPPPPPLPQIAGWPEAGARGCNDAGEPARAARGGDGAA
eukprot:141035-Chlamydomonas_euryale.AAC.6